MGVHNLVHETWSHPLVCHGVRWLSLIQERTHNINERRNWESEDRDWRAKYGVVVNKLNVYLLPLAVQTLLALDVLEWGLTSRSPVTLTNRWHGNFKSRSFICFTGTGMSNCLKMLDFKQLIIELKPLNNFLGIKGICRGFVFVVNYAQDDAVGNNNKIRECIYKFKPLIALIEHRSQYSYKWPPPWATHCALSLPVIWKSLLWLNLQHCLCRKIRLHLGKSSVITETMTSHFIRLHLKMRMY